MRTAHGTATYTTRSGLAGFQSFRMDLGGKAGGHPAVLSSFFGENLGTKSVTMHYEGTGKNQTLKIPGIVDAELDTLEGQDGKPITIENHPVCIAPGVPAMVARSKHFRLSDYGYDWKLSGRNGYTSAFTYSGA